MKKKVLAVLAVTALFCTGVAASHHEKADKQDVIWPAENIKWDAGPAPGIKMAKLWGDMNKGGNYGVLVKFDAGVMHPIHWHSKTLKLVMISGTFVHQSDGGPEAKLGPGSYLVQVGGKKHISGCAAGAECTFFMESDGKFDMIEPKK